MRRIELHAAVKRFGSVTALDSIDLTIEPGEHLAVLGPSGSGKSTLLRIIAGLEDLDDGDITFDGTTQRGIEPHERDVALVFQQYSLYPHLTALGNITIGLRHGRRLSAADADARARKVSETLGIEALLDRRPKAMSGGQRQRIALARALARQSGVVLLDEPLSGLDAQLRLTLRVEITSHLHATGATTVHVTHDQSDAMTSADRVAVMEAGRIVQLGTPSELYDTPATLFVAKFVGTPPMNIVPIADIGDGRGLSSFGEHQLRLDPAMRNDIVAGFRPEDLRLDDTAPWTTTGTVVAVEHAGPERIVHLAVDGHTVAARTPATALPSEGETIVLSVDPERIHVFAGEGGHRHGIASELSPIHHATASIR